mmetsp:Transcript_62566/g.110399  ORF Transcript_62566/g.110399 Transcript_62566/m.110399 type:complete len:899 (+) Transcript_62566:32-2728(+)
MHIFYFQNKDIKSILLLCLGVALLGGVLCCLLVACVDLSKGLEQLVIVERSSGHDGVGLPLLALQLGLAHLRSHGLQALVDLVHARLLLLVHGTQILLKRVLDLAQLGLLLVTDQFTQHAVRLSLQLERLDQVSVAGAGTGQLDVQSADLHQIGSVELSLDVALPHRLEVASLVVEPCEAGEHRRQLAVSVSGRHLKDILGRQEVLRGGRAVTKLALEHAHLHVLQYALLAIEAVQLQGDCETLLRVLLGRSVVTRSDQHIAHLVNGMRGMHVVGASDLRDRVEGLLRHLIGICMVAFLLERLRRLQHLVELRQDHIGLAGLHDGDQGHNVRRVEHHLGGEIVLAGGDLDATHLGDAAHHHDGRQTGLQEGRGRSLGRLDLFRSIRGTSQQRQRHTETSRQGLLHRAQNLFTRRRAIRAHKNRQLVVNLGSRHHRGSHRLRLATFLVLFAALASGGDSGGGLSGSGGLGRRGHEHAYNVVQQTCNGLRGGVEHTFLLEKTVQHVLHGTRDHLDGQHFSPEERHGVDLLLALAQQLLVIDLLSRREGGQLAQVAHIHTIAVQQLHHTGVILDLDVSIAHLLGHRGQHGLPQEDRQLAGLVLVLLHHCGVHVDLEIQKHIGVDGEIQTGHGDVAHLRGVLSREARHGLLVQGRHRGSKGFTLRLGLVLSSLEHLGSLSSQKLLLSGSSLLHNLLSGKVELALHKQIHELRAQDIGHRQVRISAFESSDLGSALVATDKVGISGSETHHLQQIVPAITAAEHLAFDGSRERSAGGITSGNVVLSIHLDGTALCLIKHIASGHSLLTLSRSRLGLLDSSSRLAEWVKRGRSGRNIQLFAHALHQLQGAVLHSEDLLLLEDTVHEAGNVLTLGKDSRNDGLSNDALALVVNGSTQNRTHTINI